MFTKRILCLTTSLAVLMSAGAATAQSMAEIEAAGKAGHDFFVKLSGFRKLLGLSLTTEAAFIELLSSWAAQRTREEAIRSRFATSLTAN